MNIGSNSIFMGAYTERMQGKMSHADFRTQISKEKQQKVTQKVTEAMKKYWSLLTGNVK